MKGRSKQRHDSEWALTMYRDLGFEQLASYNGEVARGLVHTSEWKSKMADLQHRYNEWLSSIGEWPKS